MLVFYRGWRCTSNVDFFLYFVCQYQHCFCVVSRYINSSFLFEVSFLGEIKEIRKDKEEIQLIAALQPNKTGRTKSV